MSDSSKITIHTDGACSGNPGPGGYGTVMQYGERRNELSGGFRKTTNNRMELLAVIKGLQALNRPCEVTVFSDSKYIVDAVNKGWAKRWQANGWKRNKRDRALNPDLWAQLLVLLRYAHGQTALGEGTRGESGERARRRACSSRVPIRQPSHRRRLRIEHKGEPMTQRTLTHIDQSGNASMVDVSAKPDTERIAIAAGSVVMQPETLRLVADNAFDKGDVLAVARIAGIMGAKQTSTLIPLCHPLPLSRIAVDFELDTDASAVHITAEAKTTGKTGVEMEALTAVSVAALTIYDMCKAVDRRMRIEGVRLTRKSGGQSGDYRNE